MRKYTACQTYPLGTKSRVYSIDYPYYHTLLGSERDDGDDVQMDL